MQNASFSGLKIWLIIGNISNNLCLIIFIEDNFVNKEINSSFFNIILKVRFKL